MCLCVVDPLKPTWRPYWPPRASGANVGQTPAGPATAGTRPRARAPVHAPRERPGQRQLAQTPGRGQSVPACTRQGALERRAGALCRWCGAGNWLNFVKQVMSTTASGQPAQSGRGCPGYVYWLARWLAGPGVCLFSGRSLGATWTGAHPGACPFRPVSGCNERNAALGGPD